MKTGFEFIKSRKLEETINLTNIEQLFNFTFPPIFKIFVENFHFSSKGLQVDKHIDDLRGFEVPSEAIIYSPSKDWANPIYIDQFRELEEILSGFEEEDDWIVKGLINIGYTSIGSRICLGCLQSNQDQVWEVNDDSVFENKYSFLAENIFVFIRGFDSKKI